MNILALLYQYKRILIWILCIATATSFFIFLHRKPITFSYYGEIWADRSGYYVYLPFVFNSIRDKKQDKSYLYTKVLDNNGFSRDFNTPSTNDILEICIQ